MKAAFVFPGQGAQKVGMGRDFFERSPIGRSVFESADRALDASITELIFEGPEETLTLTANTQPAILTVSIAALKAFREQSDLQPEFVAGHSLGEYSALVAAGAMSFEDAVRTTRARGQFMQDAVPPGDGAMAAVMGNLSGEAILDICNEVADDRVVVAPANFNAPGQVVISGHADGVKRASTVLKERGARVIPLKVSAPFHSALMSPAARRLDAVLADVRFSAPAMPVITNAEARPNQDPHRIRDLLVRQVTAPVLWTDTVNSMLNAGIDVFIEFGPGNVLTGLLRRFKSNAAMISINAMDKIDMGLDTLKKLQNP
ncbi:MAG: ACP S-malonyltransferase [Myxococcota bacterium]|nr:ACP S-malonyltransferase [Myxococcota bacterium]